MNKLPPEQDDFKPSAEWLLLTPRAQKFLLNIYQNPIPTDWKHGLPSDAFKLDRGKMDSRWRPKLDRWFCKIKNHTGQAWCGERGPHCAAWIWAPGAKEFLSTQIEQPAIDLKASIEESSQQKTTTVYVDRTELEALITELQGSERSLLADKAQAERKPARQRRLGDLEKRIRKVRRDLGAAESILKKLPANGMYVQRYERKRGRWYAGQGSLQVIPRDWRPRLLPDLADYDIVNCFYNLLNQLTKKWKRWKRPEGTIDGYCSYREDWISFVIKEYNIVDRVDPSGKLKTARDIVKLEVFLPILFGRSQQTILRLLRSFLPEEERGNKPLIECVQLLMEEVESAKRYFLSTPDGKEVYSRVLKENPPEVTGHGFIYFNKHMNKDEGGYDYRYTRERWIRDCENTAFSEWLQSHEGWVIDVAEEYIHLLGGEVRLFMHDGLMVDRDLPIDFTFLEEVIRLRTGFVLTIDRKS